MTSRAVWVLVAAVACGRGDDGRAAARARVLDAIPATVSVVVVAEGRALAHPRLRPVVDVVRGELPMALGCVIDAALTSDHVAAGRGAAGELTIAIATRAPVRCHALSRVANRLWIATLGGEPASPTTSVLAAAELARARPYLLEAPLAAAVVTRELRVLATARPDPVTAWLAVDTRVGDPERIAARLREDVAALGALPELAALTGHVRVARDGPQVLVRLDAVPDHVDLALAVKAALGWAEAARPGPAPAFRCPAPQGPVLACTPQPCAALPCVVGHHVLEVSSLASPIAQLAATPIEPVVANARVEGVRLREDIAMLGLRRGDVLTSIDGRRLTASGQLVPALRRARTRMSLIVRRERQLGVLDLVTR